MNIPNTLAEITKLPIPERIQIVQAIWDTIADESDAVEEELPELSEEQKKELQRRAAELDENPDMALSWEQIKARVRRNQ